jgi:hypothetical protein
MTKIYVTQSPTQESGASVWTMFRNTNKEPSPPRLFEMFLRILIGRFSVDRFKPLHNYTTLYVSRSFHLFLLVLMSF